MKKIKTFPFTYVGQTHLGQIHRPYATVLVKSEEIEDWLLMEMIIDTGADYTLLPRKYASLLNIDLSKCLPQTTCGVGGSETVYLYKKGVTIKIGNWQKVIPVGILERDDLPALLGRLTCLETITLIFKNRLSLLEE